MARQLFLMRAKAASFALPAAFTERPACTEQSWPGYSVKLVALCEAEYKAGVCESARAAERAQMPRHGRIKLGAQSRSM